MRLDLLKRREFITLLGGVAAVWPLAASAQQPSKRRLGVLMLYDQSDPEAKVRTTALQDGLEKLGWIAGRNLTIDYHWGVGDLDWIKSATTELLKLSPDVILANGDQGVRGARLSTNLVPIIFIGGSDPVAQGYVTSLAHPGGNITGFSVLEPTVGPKWLELLTEIAPLTKKVAVMMNPDNAGSVLLSRAVIAAAQRFKVDVVIGPVRGPEEIETFMEVHGRQPGAALILPSDPTTATRRKLIIELANRYRMPAIYALRSITAEGGLMSYGISIPDLFRQSAGYVDRILRGEKPANLPVQLPTKFELVINLKSAKALGLTVPDKLLVAADEVIE